MIIHHLKCLMLKKTFQFVSQTMIEAPTIAASVGASIIVCDANWKVAAPTQTYFVNEPIFVVMPDTKLLHQYFNTTNL